jgi:hypothetical protein
MWFRFIVVSLLVLTRAEGQNAPFASLEGEVLDNQTGGPASPARIRIFAFQKEPAYATTDRQGRFRFQHLTTGRYELQVDCPGFIELVNAPRQPGSYFSTNVDLTAERDAGAIPGGPQFSKTVGSDGNVRGMIAIRLNPAAVIRGKLTDPDGIAMGREAVSLLALNPAVNERPVYPGEPVRPLQTAFTDDRGEYRLPNLLPGTYYVAAVRKVAPQGSVRVYRTTFAPGTMELDRAKKIELTAGNEITADIRLVNEPGVTLRGRLIPPESLKGSKTLSTGVSLMPARPSLLFPDPEPVRTTTGEFEFHAILPGTYTVTAVAADTALRAYQPVAGVTLVIEIKKGQESASDLQLQLLTEVKGQVVFAEGCKTVPVQIRAESAGLNRVSSMATSEAGGNFVLKIPSPAILRVSATPFGLPSSSPRASSIRLGARDVLAEGLEYPTDGKNILTVYMTCAAN